MIPGFGKEEESALETLNGMVGVDQMREVYQQCLALAKCSVENPELKKIRKSMIFTGNPGTGKSTCAGIISRALIEAGLCTSSMVTATRSDIIGQFVGHTSPKVKKLFNQARNGILFVDEADFFLNKDSGGYVLEGLKEFVRYIEMYPDVTVIFAMYEKSVQAFYDLDAGLRSRIAGKCYFADYDDQQMCQILKNMLKKYKLSLVKGYKEILIPYIQKIRNSENFGNAREMRNVADMAIKIHCMNHSEGKTKDKNVISLDELKTAIDRLTPISAQKERRVAGFNSCWSNVTV